VDQAQDQAQREIVARAEELAKLIRTLPPTNFLTVFGNLYGMATGAAYNVFGPITPVVNRIETEQGIRHLLRYIAILAQKFDGDHPNTRYAANLMLFRASSSLDEAERRAIQPNLRFIDQTASIDQLKGVLELIPALSTVATDENASPDTQLPAICLAVPKSTKLNGLYQVLPGAPLAFAERLPSIQVQASMVARWCQVNADFTQSVREQITSYFEDSATARVRSFISIPLCYVDENDGADDKTKDPVGVLNIHCDRERLLHLGDDQNSSEPMSHFVDITRPLRLILTQLVFALNSMPADASIPPAPPGMISASVQSVLSHPKRQAHILCHPRMPQTHPALKPHFTALATAPRESKPANHSPVLSWKSEARAITLCGK
jgi:hypothetical protein